MKIVHVNTYDRGGAAIACIRIHEALLKKGVDSHILFMHRLREPIENAHYWQKKPSTTFLSKTLDKIKNVYKALYKNKSVLNEVEQFSSPRSPYDITEHPIVASADIVQLNWVSGFLDESSFFKKLKKPVVWRMPDLYACGGGYHYEKNFPFDLLRRSLKKHCKIREKALQEANITFVPISNWVAQKAQESKLIGRFPRKLIHNGLDMEAFKVLNKAQARRKFSFDSSKKYILLGAENIRSKRKGVMLGIKALKALHVPNAIPVFFGKNAHDISCKGIKIGYFDDFQSLLELYTAVDFFLMTSIEEAFGQVTLEALACGTPVISFPNGGSRDIIKPGLNGVLAKDLSAESLAVAIQEALNFPFDKNEILEDVSTRFAIEDKAIDYIALYKNLLKI